METVNPAGHSHPPQSAPPCNCIGLAAGLRAKRIRRVQPPPDNFIKLFVEIYERLFHNDVRVAEADGGGKDVVSSTVKSVQPAAALRARFQM